MMHELSQSGGMIRWFQDYPYGYYHANTTPLYVIASDEYLTRSGDRVFLKESWESLKKAYSYCVSADKTGNGLMENTVAGLGASELGSLQENLLTDVFLGAATVQAMHAMSRSCEGFKSTWLCNDGHFSFAFRSASDLRCAPRYLCSKSNLCGDL
jgi:hypothetical protein